MPELPEMIFLPSPRKMRRNSRVWRLRLYSYMRYRTVGWCWCYIVTVFIVRAGRC